MANVIADDKTETTVDDVSEQSDSNDEMDEFDDQDDQDDFNQLDIGQILSNFFVTEDGTNIAEALFGIKKSLDTHNKLMLKMLNK